MTEKGWYPDPDGTAKLRYWDGSRWTIHYADVPGKYPRMVAWLQSIPARLSVARAVFGVLWLLVIAAVSVGALVDRPEFADVRADSWAFLIVLSAPPILIALIFVRTPAILGVTAALSGLWSVANAWSTMRDTHSTAALGLVYTPTIALVIVGVGCIVDSVWRAVRSASRERG